MKRSLDMNEARLSNNGKTVHVVSDPIHIVSDPGDHSYSDHEGKCWYCGEDESTHRSKVDCSTGVRRVVNL